MNPRPYIPRLSPDVINIDAERAWRELQVAIKAACALAEQGEANARPPADCEPMGDDNAQT